MACLRFSAKSLPSFQYSKNTDFITNSTFITFRCCHNAAAATPVKQESILKILANNFVVSEIEGILPKAPHPPCLRMADRALLAGCPRNTNDRKADEPSWSAPHTWTWMVAACDVCKRTKLHLGAWPVGITHSVIITWQLWNFIWHLDSFHDTQGSHGSALGWYRMRWILTGGNHAIKVINQKREYLMAMRAIDTRHVLYWRGFWWYRWKFNMRQSWISIAILSIWRWGLIANGLAPPGKIINYIP